MSNYEQTVFISYAWGGEREEIVDQIDKALQKRGIKITRDKRDLEYKGSIKEFMERIGQGSSVIVVVSDKYGVTNFIYFSGFFRCSQIRLSKTI